MYDLTNKIKEPIKQLEIDIFEIEISQVIENIKIILLYLMFYFIIFLLTKN